MNRNEFKQILKNEMKAVRESKTFKAFEEVLASDVKYFKGMTFEKCFKTVLRILTKYAMEYDGESFHISRKDACTLLNCIGSMEEWTENGLVLAPQRWVVAQSLWNVTLDDDVKDFNAFKEAENLIEYWHSVIHSEYIIDDENSYFLDEEEDTKLVLKYKKELFVYHFFALYYNTNGWECGSDGSSYNTAPYYTVDGVIYCENSTPREVKEEEVKEEEVINEDARMLTKIAVDYLRTFNWDRYDPLRTIISKMLGGYDMVDLYIAREFIELYEAGRYRIGRVEARNYYADFIDKHQNKEDALYQEAINFKA